MTHAHADHARWGMKHYLAHEDSREVLKLRLGADISLETVPYAQSIFRHGVEISLHPAGHIPGSAQIRLSHKGRVAVVSGDYKVEDDGLATPFTPVPCHEFVSECTFGLPIYKWPQQQQLMAEINNWWATQAAAGYNVLLFAYSLGKAQRILKHLDASIGPIFVHGAIHHTNEALKENGIPLPEATLVTRDTPKSALKGACIIAPPAAMNSPWAKKFSPYRTGICSGWMNIRGTRRRKAADAGFVLSDHADWEGLNQAIEASGAETVYLTHGSTHAFARYLSEEKGRHAVPLETLFEGEQVDAREDHDQEAPEA
ncbi:ligase-associated DNA damage response exonuclease [Nitritalea halalkaliphila]|nr:ligase-associated DNA damage response exonuclease [Nitritalea halalkaliphila]